MDSVPDTRMQRLAGLAWVPRSGREVAKNLDAKGYEDLKIW